MLIDADKFLDLLEDMIEQQETNVADYEGFHGDRLANIPTMAPMDAFLYGLASGKLQQVTEMRDMVKTRMKELEYDRD